MYLVDRMTSAVRPGSVPVNCRLGNTLFRMLCYTRNLGIDVHPLRVQVTRPETVRRSARPLTTAILFVGISAYGINPLHQEALQNHINTVRAL